MFKKMLGNRDGMAKLSDLVTIPREPSSFKVAITNELFRENFLGSGADQGLEALQAKYFEKEEGRQYCAIKSIPEGYQNQSVMDITGIMWVKQHKENKTTDRYIIKGIKDGKTLFSVSDVFFADNTYIIKLLGIYLEVGKLASVNFKHQGNVEAQAVTNLKNVPVYVIPEYSSFLKRCNPFYFWLELFGA